MGAAIGVSRAPSVGGTGNLAVPAALWIAVCGVAIGTALSVAPTPACAQLLRLGRWDGAIEGVTDLSRLSTTSDTSGSSQFDTTRFAEQLTLRNTGMSLYDLRLVTMSLGGDFGLSQEWADAESRSAFRKGTLHGYDVFMGVLPEKPYALNLYANRQQSILSRELAGRSDVKSERRGLTLFARQLPIPSTLSFRQELQDETTRASDVVTHREDRQNILTYEGQRGWIDSDLDVRYEFIDEADPTTPNFGYRSHEATLTHGIDLGTELNRHLDSRLELLTRTGATDLTTRRLEETLRVDHNDRLQSEYRYALLTTDTAGGATTTHTGVVRLQHQLYESLHTTLESDGVLQQLPGGNKGILRGRTDVAYVKRLPGDGRLMTNIGGGLEYEDDRFEATVSFVPQELHSVDATVALPIVLRNVFVVASSVVVIKTAFGPLPAGCLPPSGPPTSLALGRDFTLRGVGDFTQIVPVPCSGSIPGMNPGDTIAVDYQFDVSQSLVFATAGWHVDLSVDYQWIRPYASHSQTTQSLIDGRDGRLLHDRQSDTVGTELRFDGRRLRARALGEVGRFNLGGVSYDQFQSSQSVSLSIRTDLTLSANADQALLTFLDEDRQTLTRLERVTLSYTPSGTLFIEAQGGLRHLHDTLTPTERVLESRLTMQWFLRGLEVNPMLAWLNRRHSGTETKELQVFVRLKRRF